MNSHLKLLLYIGMIVGIFLLVQNKFDLFDIKLVNKDGQVNEFMDKIPTDEDIIGKEDSQTPTYVEIYIPNSLEIRVNVEVADDESSRSAGLSNRKYLGDYDGMFFVFEKDVNTPFWMKDTLIPLDLIFLDSKGYIIDIKANQQPCGEGYCPHIYSREFYRYVLEVNANFCEENGIEIGYSVVQYLQ